MKKGIMILLILINFLNAQTMQQHQNKEKYLTSMLNLLKSNVKQVLPMKIKIGVITNVEVNKKTLILFIKANNSFNSSNVDEKKLCSTPLNKDIIQAGGTIKYIINSGKENNVYQIDKENCK